MKVSQVFFTNSLSILSNVLSTVSLTIHSICGNDAHVSLCTQHVLHHGDRDAHFYLQLQKRSNIHDANEGPEGFLQEVFYTILKFFPLKSSLFPIICSGTAVSHFLFRLITHCK